MNSPKNGRLVKCFTNPSLLNKYDKYLSKSSKSKSSFRWSPTTPKKRTPSVKISPIISRKRITKKVLSKSPTYSPVGGYSPPKKLY
jgi:hypothetical protein